MTKSLTPQQRQRLDAIKNDFHRQRQRIDALKNDLGLPTQSDVYRVAVDHLYEHLLRQQLANTSTAIAPR
jgi:hypothetical protein